MHALAEKLGFHQNPDVRSGQTTFSCTSKIFQAFQTKRAAESADTGPWSKRKTTPNIAFPKI